jgi:hypothetical protein
VRKRILIGAIAVVVVGVLVTYVLSQPKKGTVQYHKRELAKAVAMTGNWIEWSPDFLQERYWGWRLKRVRFHWDALVEAGYLTQREFPVPSRRPRYVGDSVRAAATQVFTNESDITLRVLHMQVVSENALLVTAPAEAMNKLAEMIREADAVPTGE